MYRPPEPLRSLVEFMSRDITVSVKPVIYGRYGWVYYVVVRSGLGLLEMLTASTPGILIVSG
ncbi:MAG: hypothetical protein QXD24_01945 [Candidatus Caldarchaeum sp.]|jgi:hypothetical protein